MLFVCADIHEIFYFFTLHIVSSNIFNTGGLIPVLLIMMTMTPCKFSFTSVPKDIHYDERM